MADTMSEGAAKISSSTSSLWDRASIWVSENKAVAYTIAGTAVVVSGAGVVYYLSDANKGKSTIPKKSKKERRKEKKEAEEAQKKADTTEKDVEAGK